MMRGRVTRCSVLLAALLALPTALGAQTVAGRVVDRETRRPLPRLTVIMLADGARAVATTATDSAGIFSIDAPAAGTYRLRFAIDHALPHETDTLSLAAMAYVEREFLLEIPRHAYALEEVESPASVVRGTANLRYPPGLREEGAEGRVLVQFVVDSTGRYRAGSLRVFSATDFRFVSSLEEGLPRMRFKPARYKGRTVAQVVRQSFSWTLAR